jgi:hypothetical protein
MFADQIVWWMNFVVHQYLKYSDHFNESMILKINEMKNLIFQIIVLQNCLTDNIDNWNEFEDVDMKYHELSNHRNHDFQMGEQS